MFSLTFWNCKVGIVWLRCEKPGQSSNFRKTVWRDDKKKTCPGKLGHTITQSDRTSNTRCVASPTSYCRATALLIPRFCVIPTNPSLSTSSEPGPQVNLFAVQKVFYDKFWHQIPQFATEVQTIHVARLWSALIQRKSPPRRHLEFGWKAYISCQNYLRRIVKFGEDVFNHSRAITSGRFSVRWFWPWTLTLTSQKLRVIFGGDAEHPHQMPWNQTSSSREITTNVTNERTNELTTNKHARS